MYKVLTSSEAKESESKKESKMNAWWKGLSHNERELIFDHYEKLLIKVNCLHSNTEKLPFYDKELEVCRSCNHIVRIHG